MSLFKKASITIGVLALLYVLLIFIISEDLSSPRKRELMPYHHTWLDTPEQQAVRITHRKSEVGQFPYLVVEPHSNQPAKRGRILREQLAGRNINIPPFGETRQNIILLHGRKGRKEDFLPVAERYAAVGYRCILPDLPGHGDNPVKRSHFGTSPINLQALESIIKTEENSSSFTKKPILLGMSMGGSYACQLAKSNNDLFSALIIINSFDQLENVVSQKCDSYLLEQGWVLSKPVMMCSKAIWGFDIRQADSLSALSDSNLPVFVAHGDEDKLIPISLGKNLYNAAQSPHKKWIAIKGAHHTNVLVTPHPLYADTIEFLKNL